VYAGKPGVCARTDSTRGGRAPRAWLEHRLTVCAPNGHSCPFPATKAAAS